jgi:hypothetical protein
MKVINVEEQQYCTMLTLEMDDGSLHAHAIPVGAMENRQGMWDLPDNIAPIDLILVECHYLTEEEHLDAFNSENYLKNRFAVIDAISKHGKKIKWGEDTNAKNYASRDSRLRAVKVLADIKGVVPGVIKEDVTSKCELPIGIRDEVRESYRKEAAFYRATNIVEPSPPQVFAERTRLAESMAKGHARTLEERKANEFVEDLVAERNKDELQNSDKWRRKQ